ncbi:uncharacterized protein LOC112082827 [Eutrema salsugineum]|uniref:uncharacterized protein LOC112082827 n=1 Tax=Eutrema salsugineum TaxID=72664 RepID=UPI000CED79D2|nr:uncharacterized protein LOC112082827 [Eutrema salsugineum]
MWKQILQSRNLPEKFIKVEVRNGRSTLFWFDNWSNLGNLLEVTGVRGCMDLGIHIESTVEEVIRMHRRQRHRQPILNKVEDEIAGAVSTYMETEEDIHKWKEKTHSYKTRFSTKATYEQLRSHHPQVPWSNAVWFKHHNPKFNFIAWLTLQNRLSTGERMIA